jgi:LysM repeat protein
MVTNCNKFYLVKQDEGCYDIAAAQGISLSDLYAWNAALNGDCSGLWANVYVCVGIVGGPTVTTTPSSTAKPTSTTTTPGNGVSTPTPTQTGMVSNCGKFYLVKQDEGCYDIAASQGISLSDLYTWNAALKGDCSGLWANVYVCVGLIGQTPTSKPTVTTTTSKTTTTTGNGISTPTPTQPGMVSNCNKFHFVETGQVCQQIANLYGISLANFNTWNPQAKSDCSGLWANTYACVGVIGYTPPTSTTKTSTSTKGNGVATPTPTQPGMVGNCKTFRKVVSGDTCQSITNSAKISLAQFYTWNPSVGSNCEYLQLGVYVCIGLI